MSSHRSDGNSRYTSSASAQKLLLYWLQKGWVVNPTSSKTSLEEMAFHPACCCLVPTAVPKTGVNHRHHHLHHHRHHHLHHHLHHHSEMEEDTTTNPPFTSNDDEPEVSLDDGGKWETVRRKRKRIRKATTFRHRYLQ